MNETGSNAPVWCAFILVYYAIALCASGLWWALVWHRLKPRQPALLFCALAVLDAMWPVSIVIVWALELALNAHEKNQETK